MSAASHLDTLRVTFRATEVSAGWKCRLGIRASRKVRSRRTLRSSSSVVPWFMGQIQARNLFYTAPELKRVFTFFKWLKKIKWSIICCVTWKFWSVHLSVSRNKAFWHGTDPRASIRMLPVAAPLLHSKLRLAKQEVPILWPLGEKVFQPPRAAFVIYRWGDWGPEVSRGHGKARTWTWGFIAFMASFKHQFWKNKQHLPAEGLLDAAWLGTPQPSGWAGG